MAKHPRDEDDELVHRFGKKLRLDPPTHDIIQINPTIPTEFHPHPLPSFNDYLTQKMVETYTTNLQAQGQVILKYNPEVLVVYHFQKWVTRLFNRFLVKYNRINGTKIATVKSFFKIISIINSPEYSFSYGDLFEVVFRESELELRAVLDRLARPKSSLEEIEEEGVMFNDVRYDYWDNINGLETPAGGSDQEQDEMEVEPVSSYQTVEMDEAMDQGQPGQVNFDQFQPGLGPGLVHVDVEMM